MSSYRVTPLARLEIEDITLFLALDSMNAALRFQERCDETFAWLADAPGAGRVWKAGRSANAQVRVWPVAGFPNHLIFYEAGRRGIVVLHVLAGARDLSRLFVDE